MAQQIDIAPFAVSIGDPAGIGPEIICKAWEQRREQGLHPFFVVGCASAIALYWDGPVELIDAPDKAHGCFDHALPVFQLEQCRSFQPGIPNPDSAHCAFQALEIATGFARSGYASALVTAPISKAQLYAIGFTHPGQTEFVAERCGIARENAVMMLAGPDLRVVPMTTHIPLAEVRDRLTAELIVARIRATARGLTRNFGIAAPRLALAGFNPHAGEQGKMGMEEIEIFQPAIEIVRAEGIDVTDPLPADTLFHARARRDYDAALCAYHDQALIPLKTLYFDEAVNMTLGLPIVRTSPDHGTAFGIAGRNIANPGSMIAALRMAHQASLHRLADKAA